MNLYNLNANYLTKKSLKKDDCVILLVPKILNSQTSCDLHIESDGFENIWFKYKIDSAQHYVVGIAHNARKKLAVIPLRAWQSALTKQLLKIRTYFSWVSSTAIIQIEKREIENIWFEYKIDSAQPYFVGIAHSAHKKLAVIP